MTKIANQCYKMGMNTRNAPQALYGESIFTSGSVRGGKVLFKKQHIDRILKGIEDYFVRTPMSDHDTFALRTNLEEMLDEISVSDCYFRLTVCAPAREQIFFNRLNMSQLDINISSGKLSLDHQTKSLKTFLSPFTLDYPKMKMGSYMPHIYFKNLAKDSGYDDAVFILDNQLIELSTSNIFFVKDHLIYSPQKVLFHGITQQMINCLFDVYPKEIKTSDLGEYDFAFICNSVNLVSGVNKIDSTKFNCDNDFINSINKKLIDHG